MEARFMSMKRRWCIALLVLLGACASKDNMLYHWGSYPDQIYEGFQIESGNASPDKQLQKLQEEQQKAVSKGKALPPGFRAHMGYLYFQTGQTDQAAMAFEAEKKHFPESATYMDFALNQLRKP
ncbi:MAG: DUF4810 domain-containing protein [Betaproteobacteria bacterium]|jgi:hypothetical protein|nr:DUF4810 domain-containing protein [Betaproteobacteria bacterium]